MRGAAIPIQARMSAGCDWNSCKLLVSSREANQDRGQQLVQMVMHVANQYYRVLCKRMWSPCKISVSACLLA